MKKEKEETAIQFKQKRKELINLRDHEINKLTRAMKELSNVSRMHEHTNHLEVLELINETKEYSANIQRLSLAIIQCEINIRNLSIEIKIKYTNEMKTK